ncbi:MAG: twin-arginine translocation pathway signal protein [Acidobacteria bacterium 13_1_40CM_56_16]|nr:MAG: twin-arginine translocation pathway signal protein [Acidobacteria bacterium 13_1_40CM_56_16]
MVYPSSTMNRRKFLLSTASAGVASVMSKKLGAQDPEIAPITAEIRKRHNEAVQRLQQWIRQPSIAAENRGVNEGCELTMRMLREAGFNQVKKVPTEGQPGIFATLDAGAPKTLALYFMYDVKQVDQGGSFLAEAAAESLGHAAGHRYLRRSERPHLVFVAEGEEEIGSPHFIQIVDQPEVQAALKRCVGVFMPNASQGLDGQVTITLGAKGVIECELTSSGERWGRGPKQDIHSSNKARVDSPAWHLVQALATLVNPDGTPAIDGFALKARPISPDEKKMIAVAAARLDEISLKKQLGVEHWIRDVKFQESLELLMSQPTVNIEGLVGGYTGPGGKTILPHKAVAKLDLRLVPDMTAKDALTALKAHLAKRGFGDIDVNMTGGYDPTSTPADASLIRAQQAVYRRHGVDPMIMPRNAGSWPGYVFTGPPLRLPAGHFGLGHGNGAHAPDEYFVIESSNPKVQGIDGATGSFVEYLYEVAKTA